jgi:hypothetical protein
MVFISALVVGVLKKVSLLSSLEGNSLVTMR